MQLRHTPKGGFPTMESQDSSQEKLAPNSDLEPSLEEWMATVDSLKQQIEPILREAYPNKRGRPSYPTLSMFKAYLCRIRMPSLRQLHERLTKDMRLLALTGLCRAPTHQTFSNFFIRLGFERFLRILILLVRALKRVHPSLGKHLSIDGTVVKAFARRNRGFLSRADPDARLGFKEIKSGGKPDFEFGYRVTIGCDTDLELPVAFAITPANANESRLMLRILRQAKEQEIAFEYVIADKAYDSRLNHAIILSHKAIPIIPMNPRGSKIAKETGRRPSDVLLPIRRNSERWRELYAKRSASERLFSSLKEHGGFRTLKTRRLNRVSSYLTLCMIGKLLAALSAIRLGRNDLTRSMLVWSY
jgi:transposase